MRGKCQFRKTTLKRAIETIEACGKSIASVEIDQQGKIIILTGTPGEAPSGANLTEEIGKWSP